MGKLQKEGLTRPNNAGRGGFQQRDMGPPATVLEMGKFIHACEGEMVVESTNPKVPHFNAPIYLENKVRLHSPYNPFIFLLCSRPSDNKCETNRRQSARSTKSSAR
jgi:hypothetical protein